MRKKFQKGISLYFTVILTGVVLAIALSLSSILISQMKIFREIGYSTKAFYAADSGIERALIEIETGSGCSQGAPCVLTLSNGASYSVYDLSSGSSGCTAANYCVYSTGVYQSVKRAINANY